MASTHEWKNFRDNVEKTYWSELIVKRIMRNVTRNTVNIADLGIDTGIITNVPIFYHCPGEPDTSNGWKAFSQNDHVIVLVEKTSENDPNPSYSVVGHRNVDHLSTCPKPYLLLYYYNDNTSPHQDGPGYVWDGYANTLADGREFGPKIGLPEEPIDWPLRASVLKDLYASYRIDLGSSLYDNNADETKRYSVWRSPASDEVPDGSLSSASRKYYGVGSLDGLGTGEHYITTCYTNRVGGQAWGLNASADHPIWVYVQRSWSIRYYDYYHTSADFGWTYDVDGLNPEIWEPNHSRILVSNTRNHPVYTQAHAMFNREYNYRQDRAYRYWDMVIGENSSTDYSVKLYWPYDEVNREGPVSSCLKGAPWAMLNPYIWNCNKWNYDYSIPYHSKDIIGPYADEKSSDAFYKRFMYQIRIRPWYFFEAVGQQSYTQGDIANCYMRHVTRAASDCYADLAFNHDPKTQVRNPDLENIVDSIIDEVKNDFYQEPYDEVSVGAIVRKWYYPTNISMQLILL